MRYLVENRGTTIKNTTAVFITLLLSFVVGCSILKKKGQAGQSGEVRQIDSLSPHYSSEQPIHRLRAGRIPSDEADLLQMLKNGEASVTKAVYFKNKNSICFVDVRGQARFVPQFVTPTPLDFPSSVVLPQDLPSCSDREKIALAHKAQNFVPEGTQVAMTPQGAMFIGGCALVAVEQLAEKYYNNPDGKSWFPYTLLGITTAGTFLRDPVPRRNAIGRVWGRMFAAGLWGYILCGFAVGYVIEILEQ